jgi:hypothetical protein
MARAIHIEKHFLSVFVLLNLFNFLIAKTKKAESRFSNGLVPTGREQHLNDKCLLFRHFKEIE